MTILSLAEQITGHRPEVIPSRRLEDLLVEPWGAGMDTASVAQRAICRALDGEDVDHEVLRARPKGIPEEAIIIAAVRSGKSVIAACSCIQCALLADTRRARLDEMPRVSILSLTLDLAKVVFRYVRGIVGASSALRARLVGEPTTERMVLRNAWGHEVEIAIAAGARAGSSLVARWCAGAVFDEAPRMQSSTDGVINVDDARVALQGRLLPGARIMYIGSPWAPSGSIYAMFRQPPDGMLVAHAPGWLLHPDYWTPERCEALREREPVAYQTDCAAEWAERETMLVTRDEAEACVATVGPPTVRALVTGAADPAMRTNAFTLVAGYSQDGVVNVCVARQWMPEPDVPLLSEPIWQEWATISKQMGILETWSDQWSFDALSETARRCGVNLARAESGERIDWYLRLQQLIRSKRIRFPRDVLPDIAAIVVHRLPGGAMRVHLPKTADGRHCDFAPAIAMLCARVVNADSPAQQEAPTPQAPPTLKQWNAARESRRRNDL